MRSVLSHSRWVLIPVLLIGIVVFFFWSRSLQIAHARTYPDPELLDVEVAFHRVHFGPDALAAAGVTGGQVAGMASDVTTQMIDNPGDLDGAQAAYVAAKIDVDELERKIRAGLASSAEIASLPAKQATLAAAIASLDAELDEVATAAVADLVTAVQNTLATIRANAANWDLPAQYLVINRTEAQWVQLRDALAHERITTRLGEDQDAATMAFLATIRADPAVVLATLNLDTNGAAVESAWASAFTAP